MSKPTNNKLNNSAIIYAVKKLVELYPDGFGTESVAVVSAKLLSKTKAYNITEITNAVNYLVQTNMIGKGFGITDQSELVSQDRVSLVMPDGTTRNITIRRGSQVFGRIVQGNIKDGVFVAGDDGDYFIEHSNKLQVEYIPMLANSDTMSRKGKLVGVKLFYDNNGENPIAKVDKTFEGKEFNTPIHTHQMGIAYELEISTQPDDVMMQELLKEYGEIPTEIDDRIINLMKETYGDAFKDKTDRPIVTIDPEDCDEEDDAVLASIITADDEKHPELAGCIKEEVAISNVGQFLLWLGRDSKTFKYYTENGTNTYMLDLVFTILLPQFNKGMGSLKPNQKRLAMYTTIWRDKDGEIVDYEINPAVVEVKAKFTYEKALKDSPYDAADELRFPNKDELEKLPKDQQAKLLMEIAARRSKYPQEILDNLDTLDKLDHLVRKVRLDNGTTSFDSDERNHRISSNGKRITGTYHDNDTQSHKNIETPALSANMLMAMEAARVGMPFIYRVEEEITEENRAKIIELFDASGIKFSGTMASSDTEFKIAINKAIEFCKTTDRFDNLPELHKLTPEEKQKVIDEKRELLSKTLSKRVIRYLPKAHYDTNNIGHSALNFEYYSHTTSPDRRAVDGVNQMQYQYYLKTGEFLFTQEELQMMCKVFNDKERAAALCDRRCQAYGDVLKVQQLVTQKVELLVNACVCDVNSNGVTVLTTYGEVNMPLVSYGGYHKPNDTFRTASNGLSVSNSATGKSYVVGASCKINITGTNPDAEVMTGIIDEMEKQPHAEMGR